MNSQLIIRQNHFSNFEELLHQVKFTNCLIVTSNGNIERGYDKSFTEVLKKNKCNFVIQKINNYPTLLDIENMFKHLRNHNFDLVISIGGGSSIDIAKIYSSCKFEEDNLTDISQLINRNSSDCIMSIAVPLLQEVVLKVQNLQQFGQRSQKKNCHLRTKILYLTMFI